MYNTVPMEAQFFLASIVAGLTVSFLYDLLRISRRIVAVNDMVVNAEDLIFFGVAAVVLFYTAYKKNSGEIRWQEFLGCAVGVWLYVFIVHNRLLNASTTVIKFVVKIVGIAIKVLLLPIRIICRVFRKPVAVVAWYTGQGIRRVRVAVKRSKWKMGIDVKNICRMLRKK